MRSDILLLPSLLCALACDPAMEGATASHSAKNLRISGVSHLPRLRPNFSVQETPAQALSPHALWRRQTIDLCQRLPTPEEIECINNAGTASFSPGPGCNASASAQQTLESCVQAESFAEDTAQWIHDFTLPQRQSYVGQSALLTYSSIKWNEAQLQIGGAQSQTIRYWHANFRDEYTFWRDCLEDVPQPLQLNDMSELSQYLDKAYEPYFHSPQDGPEVGQYTDQTGRFVYVCKQRGPGYDPGTFGFDPNVSTPAEFVAYNAPSRAGSNFDACKWEMGNTEVSLANNAVSQCIYTGTRVSAGHFTPQRCGNGIRWFPCGCGENLRWCTPFSSPSGPPNNIQNLLRHAQEEKLEGYMLTKEIIRRETGILAQLDPPFTDIFNGGYSVMTSRGLRAYEMMQSNWDTGPGYHHITGNAYRTDECYSQITGVSKNNPNAPRDHSQDPVLTYCIDPNDDSTCTPVLRSPIGQNSITVCPDGKVSATVPYSDSVDWQIVRFDQPVQGGSHVPLRYRSAGVLTTTQLMRRYPTEPNLGAAIYRFFTCDDIRWRPPAGGGSNWSLGAPDIDGARTLQTPNSMGPLTFSPLVRTTAAHGPLDDPALAGTCRGCHLTVNPIAAFRNRWDAQGIFGSPQTLGYGLKDDHGIFLSQGAEGMRGLGDLMAGSRQVHSCIVRRHFKRVTGIWLDSHSPTLDQLTQVFVGGTRMRPKPFDLRTLYLSIVATDEYRSAR